MIRHAILLANPARSDEPSLDVGAAQLKQNIGDIAERLGNLGKWGFDVTQVVNERHDKASSLLREFAMGVSRRLKKQPADDDSCVLLYYFGHGVQRNQDLHLVFRDSSTDSPSTMLRFGNIVEQLSGYNIDRVVAVLDCCYAGATAYPVKNTSDLTSFAIVASTDALSRAEVRPSTSPFGAFSRVFFANLRDIDAATQGANEVTLASLFSRTATILKDEGYSQRPKLIDGGLRDLVLTETHPEPVVDPRYRDNAPTRSYYRKLYWLCEDIKMRPGVNGDAIYERVEVETPPEFMTPVTREGETTYEPVKRSTLGRYLTQAVRLSVAEYKDEGLRLTRKGGSLMAREGRNFNTELRDCVDELLGAFGYSYVALDGTIRELLARREVPDARNIYFAARRRHRLLIRSDEFSVLLKLLTYAGYFRYTSKRTYYPY